RSSNDRLLHLEHLAIDGAPRDTEGLEHIEDGFRQSLGEQLRFRGGHENGQQRSLAYTEDELLFAEAQNGRVPVAQNRGGYRRTGLSLDAHPVEQLLGATDREHGGCVQALLRALLERARGRRWASNANERSPPTAAQ